MTIDRDYFFATVKPLFGGRLRQTQVDGMNAILDGWEAERPDEDSRWLAYMLATTFHETRREMTPVKEAYWLSEEWRKRNLSYYPYYGRGYVQLTHRGNYVKAGAYVHDDLENHPDLALRPSYTATIMFVGMIEGWFRKDTNGVPHSLKRYFNNSVDDPIRARRIINGYEAGVAENIADYHRQFLAAVGAQSHRRLFDEQEAVDFNQRFSPGIDFQASRDADYRSSDTREIVADIVTAYVEHNQIAPDALVDLVANLYLAIDNAPYLSSRIADEHDEIAKTSKSSRQSGKSNVKTEGK